MDKLYRELFTELASKLTLRIDKPEETIDSTLKALWQLSAGNPVSAEKALNLPLPELTDSEIAKLKTLIEQRISGQPLAYLTCRQSFMGFELIADNRALIPRKETEILGRKSLSICQKILETKHPIQIFDLCCGSGNLAVTLASMHNEILVYASDLSPEAVDLTRENIGLLNIQNQVTAVVSDLFASFHTEKFYSKIDIVVCNPPYISTSKAQKMDSEISENEPLMAFDGGMLGTKIIQKIIQESPKFLVPEGWLVFEVGLGQGPFAVKLCENSGNYQKIESATDDEGNIRVIAAQFINNNH